MRKVYMNNASADSRIREDESSVDQMDQELRSQGNSSRIVSDGVMYVNKNLKNTTNWNSYNNFLSIKENMDESSDSNEFSFISNDLREGSYSNSLGRHLVQPMPLQNRPFNVRIEIPSDVHQQDSAEFVDSDSVSNYATPASKFDTTAQNSAVPSSSFSSHDRGKQSIDSRFSDQQRSSEDRSQTDTHTVATNADQRIQKDFHIRKDSESSTVSNTSGTSMPTSTNAVSKDKRFVRYAMSTQRQHSSLKGNQKWDMDNVLRWLDQHGFNDSWKSTFRRNEISGNRFLELGNYEKNSMIWKQFSKYLDTGDSVNSVDRFIELIKMETLESVVADEAISYHTRSRESSGELPNSPVSLGVPNKSENRKSAPNFQKHRSMSSSSNSANSLSIQNNMAPRPVSYIDPTGLKSTNKESIQSSHKIFRKHNRSSSSENPYKEHFSNAYFSTNRKQIGKNFSHADDGASRGRKSSDSFDSNSTPSSKAEILGKKGGLLGALKKYGGNKAAELVKQVQYSNTPKHTGSVNASKRNSLFSTYQQKNREGHPKSKDLDQVETLSNHSQSSQTSRTISSKTPDIQISQFDENLVAVCEDSVDEEAGSIGETGDVLSGKLYVDWDISTLDNKYVPKLSHIDRSNFKILVTKDNISFVPILIGPNDIVSIVSLKDKITRSMNLINFGRITLHLTDFLAQEGTALEDHLFFRIIKSRKHDKFSVHQELSSPSLTNTHSTTSSDSKSFEIKGENNEGGTYPATPQYLLQKTEDNVDYWNFKDPLKNERLSKMNQVYGIPKNDHENIGVTTEKDDFVTFSNQAFPLRLPFPVNKNSTERKNDSKVPTLSINTQEIGTTKSASSSPNSFRVLRKEGREIDFDKRKQSLESKPPKLIPNIYSSSMTDSLKSPVSASTITVISDEERAAFSPVKTVPIPSESITQEASEKEKHDNIVAKRAAPPPPMDKMRIIKGAKQKLSKSSVVSSISEESAYSSRSNSSIDSKVNSSFSGTRSSRSFSRKSTLNKHIDAFKENDISFDNVSEIAQDSISDGSSDEDFFVKKMKPKKEVEGTSAEQCDSYSSGSDDDFFMKPTKKSTPRKFTLSETADSARMSVRPPVEEVFNNLEKYFPNTNLDKPIIDDSPDSPFQSSPVQPFESSSDAPIKKPTISRTFSNANNSPITKTNDDDVIYGANQGSNLSRRRMKTIRVVANEARKRRMERQGGMSTSSKESVNEEVKPERTGLARANTKMWGQKVVEVTSAEIESNLVNKIRNNKNGQFEQFAWIKGELIGRGSFGAVYLGLNVTTGEMLAVKQVVVAGSFNSKSNEGIDAFHKEVETMKDLDHLNIVQYLGFEKKHNIYSLFLEYVAGGSISSCMKLFGKFEERLVKFITRQVLMGLEYLHSNKILHRDLKADNLLLEIDGTCKISDFGISKKSKDIYVNNAEMSMQGTVFWMAPEVIDSIVADKKRGYSAKVDIWSLGCVVLEMFAGNRPWSNEAVVSAIYKIGKTKLAPPISQEISKVISPEAKDFIKKCFTIDPEERPTAKELLQHRFMEPDPSFDFSTTKLAKLIKFNSRKSMVHD